MLKVCSITAFALVQAFVLFIGPTSVSSSTSSSVAPSQTNANTIPHCQIVCHQVTNVTSSTPVIVSSITPVMVSSITQVIVSSITSAIVISSTPVNVSTCSVVCSTTGSQQLSSSNTTAPTPTSSDTATPTPTSLDTATPTPASSDTATPTPTSSDTVTPTPPPSDTATPTPTSSDIVTTAPPTSSSFTSLPSFSSSVISQTPGSTVTICLLVKVSYCNDTLYGNTSSSESQALLDNITTNVINVFAKENVTVIDVELVSITCVSSTYVLVCFKVTFKLGIYAGFVIESHLKEEIKNKSLGDLPVNNTHSNVTFEGVTLRYEIKGGECQRVCCGAGGSVALVQICIPSSKCEGILAIEKEEAGHCHGEQNDLCTGNAVCTTTTSEITPSPSKASPCTVTMSTTSDKNAKCSDWEAVDNQCEKCTDGGGGPFKIKRKCTVENQNSCDYVINEETDSTECVKYCDGSNHSPSVALVLLLTIATAFRYTVY